MNYDELFLKFRLNSVYTTNHPAHPLIRIISGVFSNHLRPTYQQDQILAEDVNGECTFKFTVNCLMAKSLKEAIEYNKTQEFNNDLKELIDEKE